MIPTFDEFLNESKAQNELTNVTSIDEMPSDYMNVKFSGKKIFDSYRGSIKSEYLHGFMLEFLNREYKKYDEDIHGSIEDFEIVDEGVLYDIDEKELLIIVNCKIPLERKPLRVVLWITDKLRLGDYNVYKNREYDDIVNDNLEDYESIVDISKLV